MAYRCKHCGYVFKSSDSDLCPECFTARDDIDCFSFSDSHTHAKDRDDPDTGYLEEQLRSERKRSRDELGEMTNDMFDQLKRHNKSTGDIPPNTFDKAGSRSYYDQSKQPSWSTSTYNGGKSTLYHTTGLESYPEQQNKPNKKGCGCMVAFAILVFLVPFISIIASVVMDIKESGGFSGIGGSSDPDSSDDSGFYMVSYENDDGSIKVTADRFVKRKDFSSFDEMSKDDSKIEIIKAEGNDDLLAGEDEWGKYYCNIELEGSAEFEQLFIQASDENNNMMYCYFYYSDEPTASYYNVPIYSSGLTVAYHIFADYKTDDGESDYFEIILTPEDLDELVKNTNALDVNIDMDIDFSMPDVKVPDVSMPEIPSLYNYDYSGSDLELSDTFDNARLTRGYYSINLENAEGYDDIIFYIDNTLKNEEWAVNEITITMTDTDEELKPDNVSYQYEGYDADGLMVFTADRGDGPAEIPVCSKVKYYRLVLDYEVNGESKVAEFVFDKDEIFSW